ncbi:hypothetical protein Pelo_630 [Pelomyxa schiedti]|nr:hypothetical protein Pelo_630 [Pelomyxa schiedti]
MGIAFGGDKRRIEYPFNKNSSIVRGSVSSSDGSYDKIVSVDLDRVASISSSRNRRFRVPYILGTGVICGSLAFPVAKALTESRREEDRTAIGLGSAGIAAFLGFGIATICGGYVVRHDVEFAWGGGNTLTMSEDTWALNKSPESIARLHKYMEERQHSS